MNIRSKVKSRRHMSQMQKGDRVSSVSYAPLSSAPLVYLHVSTYVNVANRFHANCGAITWMDDVYRIKEPRQWRQWSASWSSRSLSDCRSQFPEHVATVNKLCGRRCGRHGMPPPACNNPTSQVFIAGHGSWLHMIQPPTKFEVRRWHNFGFSINQPGDRDLWPFDLELSARYCPWGGQLSYQFWYIWDFSFSTYGPTTVRRTTWPRDLDL